MLVNNNNNRQLFDLSSLFVSVFPEGYKKEHWQDWRPSRFSDVGNVPDPVEVSYDLLGTDRVISDIVLISNTK